MLSMKELVNGEKKKANVPLKKLLPMLLNSRVGTAAKRERDEKKGRVKYTFMLVYQFYDRMDEIFTWPNSILFY